MTFGSVAVEEAGGAVLAHTLRLPGRVLRKGSVLGEEELVALRAAGLSEVTVARLEAGDVGEDEAAARLARAAGGEGLRVRAAFTGRANLLAEKAGIVVVDEGRVLGANRVDEALTLSCLHPFTPVRAGELVATAKVIPLAVGGAILDRACAVLEGAGAGEAALSVAPFRPHRCGLVLTTLAGTRPELLERSEAVTRGRLEAMGSTLDDVRTCPHEEGAVARAVSELLDDGLGPVLVLGASVAVDRDDVVPRALVRAGATVERFGIPADPGNLLVLARRGKVTLLGVPGCARSPRRSGFDEVLERVLAGRHPEGGELTAMAVGGLLKEIPARPQPREVGASPGLAFSDDARSGEGPGPVAALVLAAGRSRRMGQANKLLQPVEGVAMVARVVDGLLASGARPVVVVTGHEAARVEEALGDRPVRTVRNPDFERGMSTSLRTGLEALAEVRGALVCLGDMPGVEPATVDALMGAFQAAGDDVACVPVHGGKRGNPVLWGARFFAEMMAVQGDVGARGLLADHSESVVEVPVDDPGVLLDVDTREALLRLRGG